MGLEGERGLVEQPAAKRMKLAVPVAVGGGGGEAVSPRSRRLRQTLLVVLFLVRASARATVTASVSRIGVMLDRAFRKYHGMVFSKLNSFQRKLDTVQGQVEGLRQEVRQLARLHSNCHPDRHTRSEPNQEHASSSGSNINIHLRFQNNWKPPIYTDKDIMDENNVAIKVAVFEGDRIITTGPFSKEKIEILAIHGSFYKKFQDNWTEEDFDKHIVQGRDGQRLVLGNVWLTNGEVELSQIRFKEGSCRRKFSMAARFCRSKTIVGRVQEAIMEPVEVKDRRNESNEKSNSPRLDDDVYRLDAIAKDGAYHKRLQEANIHTVQDFLKALNKDPDELYKILKMGKKGKSWSKMTEHARKRILEDKNELKAYQTEDRNVVLFFNCVHDLVGARFSGSYIACEQFNTDHMASVKRLREHAYNRLEDIPYDYIMKGDAPERISSGTSAAAGKSVAPVDTVQPISFAEHPEAYQGTGAARNWSHDDINLVTQPTYPCANYGHPNTHDHQGQEIPPPGQQQATPSFIQPDWQQGTQGLTDFPDMFELESMADVSRLWGINL
ncbi:hypothetical protein BS78_08G099900 [Paspalum vaginatum]|nr:hypothetical protein BS78_08G099900 [Paspalum vaginatum]